jgi:endo-1,4-beta-xylanase
MTGVRGVALIEMGERSVMISTKCLLTAGVLLVAILGIRQKAWAAEPTTLKGTFHGDFLVGAALSAGQVAGEEARALELAAEQFDSITPENCLKWAEVHPKADEYDFEASDEFVEWGEANGMFIVGHTLIWHRHGSGPI